MISFIAQGSLQFTFLKRSVAGTFRTAERCWGGHRSLLQKNGTWQADATFNPVFFSLAHRQYDRPRCSDRVPVLLDLGGLLEYRVDRKFSEAVEGSSLLL